MCDIIFIKDLEKNILVDLNFSHDDFARQPYTGLCHEYDVYGFPFSEGTL